jgi:uncharacterized membrane protein YgaE (UPF0421/DUF939 family)
VPLLAVTVALSSLGFQRDARPVRVLETALGMVVGILLAEALVLLVGRGVWQLAVVLFATLLIARTLTSHPGFAIAAGVQAALVTVLPAYQDLPFQRTIDGVIGGIVALIATAVVPRDPRRASIRDGLALFDEVVGTFKHLSIATAGADQAEADAALAQIRGTQPLLAAWQATVDSAAAVSAISPFLRRHRAELHDQQVLMNQMEYATRNLRVLARRIDHLVVDGVHRPRTADLLREVEDAVVLVRGTLQRPQQRDYARQALTLVAIKLDPALLVPDAPLQGAAVILLFRPLLVDLLIGVGAMHSEAAATLPKLG